MLGQSTSKSTLGSWWCPSRRMTSWTSQSRYGAVSARADTRRLAAVLLVGMLSAFAGCGPSGVQRLENRDLASVRSEADRLSVPALEARAREYRDAIHLRQQEIDELGRQRLALGYDKQDSPEAQAIDRKLQEELAPSIRKLMSLYQVYIDTLHQKGRSTTELDL